MNLLIFRNIGYQKPGFFHNNRVEILFTAKTWSWLPLILLFFQMVFLSDRAT
ncbi:MAG: hypothetical protein ACRCT1_06415 [Microcoleaceae cyanobacterium]